MSKSIVNNPSLSGLVSPGAILEYPSTQIQGYAVSPTASPIRMPMINTSPPKLPNTLAQPNLSGLTQRSNVVIPSMPAMASLPPVLMSPAASAASAASAMTLTPSRITGVTLAPSAILSPSITPSLAPSANLAPSA